MSLCSLSRVALQKIFGGGVVFSVSFPAFFTLFVSLSSFVKNSGCGLSLSFFCCFLLTSSLFLGFFFIHQSFHHKERKHRESDLFFVRRVRHIKNVSEYTRAHINIRAATTRFGVRLFRSKRTLFFFARARERERNAVLFRAFVSLLSFFSSLGI